MDILKHAKKNYQQKIAQETKTVEVPEWGEEGSPLVLFIKPMSISDKDRITKYVLERKHHEAFVESIIVRAKDRHGLHLFSLEDKPAFMDGSIDPDIIERVAVEIAETSSVSLDQEIDSAVKN